MDRRLPVAFVALIAAGCGGGDEKAKVTPTPPPAGPSVEQAREVITGWSDALRGSNVDEAATFFTVPLVVSQGRSARLTTRARVRLFNAGLPCGSKVTGVERQEGYFVASFVLTERPGQRCDGPGNPAQVAFKLSGDRIREWRQLVQQAPPPDTEAS